jgi:hypothetical protein
MGSVRRRLIDARAAAPALTGPMPRMIVVHDGGTAAVLSDRAAEIAAFANRQGAYPTATGRPPARARWPPRRCIRCRAGVGRRTWISGSGLLLRSRRTRAILGLTLMILRLALILGLNLLILGLTLILIILRRLSACRLSSPQIRGAENAQQQKRFTHAPSPLSTIIVQRDHGASALTLYGNKTPVFRV